MNRILATSCGSLGKDFNSNITEGEWLIPVYAGFPGDDPQLLYMPCVVKDINNTGRYQIIVVEDPYYYCTRMLRYNGAQGVYKVISTNEYLLWLEEDAEVKNADEFYNKWSSELS